MKDLRKFAAEAVQSMLVGQEGPISDWVQKAKRKGFTYDEYVQRIKLSRDYKFLSQMARGTPSYKSFGGAPLTGYQRKTLSIMAEQRMKELGYLNTY